MVGWPDNGCKLLKMVSDFEGAILAQLAERSEGNGRVATSEKVAPYSILARNRGYRENVFSSPQWRILPLTLVKQMGKTVIPYPNSNPMGREARASERIRHVLGDTVLETFNENHQTINAVALTVNDIRDEMIRQQEARDSEKATFNLRVAQVIRGWSWRDRIAWLCGR